MDKKIRNILIIISIIILILGFIIGTNTGNELFNSIPEENIYVDGSDVSGVVELTVFFASKIIGTIIIFGSIVIDIIIWILYVIIMGIIKLIKSIKK